MDSVIEIMQEIKSICEDVPNYSKTETEGLSQERDDAISEIYGISLKFLEKTPFDV